jgi:hypothetical protein
MKAVVDNYPWFALQTRSSYEHFVAAMLRGKGYELFLGLIFYKGEPAKRQFNTHKCAPSLLDLADEAPSRDSS